jgi:hypothetical protein
VKALRVLWGLGLLGALGAAPTLGCQTHRCDPQFVCINKAGAMKFVSDPSACTPDGGDDGLPGYMPIPGYNTVVSSDGNTATWATSTLDGPWLDFPGNLTYIIDIPPPLAGHSLFLPQVCVSADNTADPDASHANYICGPAYLAEITNDPGYQHITVSNAACAHYSLLLELQANVATDGGPPVDSSDDADAGSAD